MNKKNRYLRLTKEIVIDRIEDGIRRANEQLKFYRRKIQGLPEGDILGRAMYRERADNEAIKIALLEDLLKD
ncbi:MAG: hypothetical protein M0R66_09765 [Candidatus Omnitrophica bacterium]|jgi:hypothetical protein|nr:hypothetical protein [Candidatus Omnitrophota bacterium]